MLPRVDDEHRPLQEGCKSDAQLHMLAKILFVGVQHRTDNFGQELFHLLRGAAGEIFGAQYQGPCVRGRGISARPNASSFLAAWNLAY